MPKFKYTPKKDNLFNETINTQEDENTKIENTPQRKPFNSETISGIKPQPFPQQFQPKPAIPVTPIPQKTAEEKPLEKPVLEKMEQQNTDIEIDIPDFLSPKIEVEDIVSSNNRENIVEKTIKNVETKNKKKLNLPFKNFKLNKKLMIISLSAVFSIALIIGIINLCIPKTHYSITSQDLIATYSNTIEEGALIDIKNSVPLNLSIRDFNIAVPDEKEITLSLWDFTDTNQNKVTIYVNGEITKSDILISKKVSKIKVPADAKVEIMQTETTNSPYTPYALTVNGVTYFNRLSSEKTNTYQFIKMEEKQELTIEDFKEPIPTDSEDLDE